MTDLGLAITDRGTAAFFTGGTSVEARSSDDLHRPGNPPMEDSSS